MAQEKFELTKQGCIELYEEITYLTTEARKQNVKAIQDARAQGDLSENADYDAARAEQARIEGRIAEIETILKNSIIKISKEEQKNLDSELKELEETLKPSSIKLIEEFESRGTLTDEADINAFADARVNYAKIDGRIEAIKVIIEKAIIQDKSNKVSTGKEIEIEFDNGKKASYKLVGTIEADPLNGKISNTSPLGKAIMGNKVGDKISFKTETGKERKVTILSVK